MITKRARMQGYMFSDYADDFPRIMQALELALLSPMRRAGPSRYAP